MAANRDIVPQWDLAQTTRDSSLAVREVIAACSVDDVQYQAVLAFETLGKELLVNADRINDAIDALGGTNNERITRLKVSVGLRGDGLASKMRNSVGCISAFVLVVACKTCYEDARIASILKQLMINHGVYQKESPASSQQLIRLLEAVTPYGDQLIPIEEFSGMANKVLSLLDDSSSMPGLLSEMPTEAVAEVLHTAFEAIRDQDIQRVTLDGCLGGIWLATALWWLHKDDVQVRVGKDFIAGDPGSNYRLEINFNATYGNDWHFVKWRNQKEIPSLIRVMEGSEAPAKPHGLFPRASARSVLSNQHRLSSSEEELCGHLVAALVTVAVERGILASQLKDNCTADVQLADLCSEHFLSNYNAVAESFGWQITREFQNEKNQLAKAITLYLDEFKADLAGHERNTRDYLECIPMALGWMEASNEAAGRKLCFPLHNIEASPVIEPAVNLAAEAIYTCLFEPNPKAAISRFVLGYHYKRTTTNARAIWRIIFNPHVEADLFSLVALRQQNLNSLLATSEARFPSAGQALALAANGHVAFLQCVQSPSLSSRGCLTIRAVPGNIRAETSSEIYDAIYPSAPEDFIGERQPFTAVDHLRIFDGDSYEGLEARCDPHGYRIQHQLTTNYRDLHVMTFLQSVKPGVKSVALDWLGSTSALAACRTIDSCKSLSSFAEKRIAASLQEQRSFDSIAWIGAGHTMRDSNFKGYITLTDGDDTLRFFAAGRFKSYELMLRNGASLISCIDVLQHAVLSNSVWIILA